MIYLYYDKNGSLKEIINDKSSRKGSINVDGFSVYCELFDDENYVVSDIWYLQQFPDKTKSTEVSFIDSGYESTIPYDKNVDHKCFKDFTTYKFYKLTFDGSLLSQNGLNIGTIRLALNNGVSVLALGSFTFNVEENVIKTDNFITQSQYDYLIQLISDKDPYFNDININNLTIRGKVKGNFTPYENDLYDLGSSSKQWQDLFLSGKLKMKGKDTLVRSSNDELTLYSDENNYIRFDEGKLETHNSKNFELIGNKVVISSDPRTEEDASTSNITFDNHKLSIIDTNEIDMWTYNENNKVKLGGKEYTFSTTTKQNNIFAIKIADNELPLFMASDKNTIYMNGIAYYNGQLVQTKKDDWSTKDAFYINKAGSLLRMMILDQTRAKLYQDSIELGENLQNTSSVNITGNNLKITCGAGEIIADSMSYNGSEIVNQDNLKTNVFDLSAYDLEMTLDDNYVLTIKLKNKNGEVIASQNVDFPTESSIVNIEWDKTNNALIFTLRNGNKTSVPIGSILTGLVTETKLSEVISPINTNISDLQTRVGQLEDESNVGVYNEVLEFTQNYSVDNEVLGL